MLDCVQAYLYTDEWGRVSTSEAQKTTRALITEPGEELTAVGNGRTAMSTPAGTAGAEGLAPWRGLSASPMVGRTSSLGELMPEPRRQKDTGRVPYPPSQCRIRLPQIVSRTTATDGSVAASRCAYRRQPGRRAPWAADDDTRRGARRRQRWRQTRGRRRRT